MVCPCNPPAGARRVEDVRPPCRTHGRRPRSLRELGVGSRRAPPRMRAHHLHIAIAHACTVNRIGEAPPLNPQQPRTPTWSPAGQVGDHAGHRYTAAHGTKSCSSRQSRSLEVHGRRPNGLVTVRRPRREDNNTPVERDHLHPHRLLRSMGLSASRRGDPHAADQKPS